MTNLALSQPSASALLVELFETLGDFQFEHRPISGGDLVEQLAQWMQSKLPAYRTLCAGEPQIGMGALKNFFTSFSDLYQGSNSVNGANLVDAVGEWLSRTHATMPLIVGGAFTAQVACKGDGSSYWSEHDGWGELCDATAFFLNPPRSLIGSSDWTAVDLEATLLAEAHRLVEECAEADAPRG